MPADPAAVFERLEAAASQPAGPQTDASPSAAPLRIAFIGARGVVGTYSGIETYYEEVGSRLAARGHEVTAYCRSFFTPGVASHRGIRVRRLPAVRTKHLETLSHSFLATCDSLLRGYDLVQFHAIGNAPWALLPRLLGAATVVSVRGLDWRRPKWRLPARWALRFGEWAACALPTATVVVSRTLQEHFARFHRISAVFIPNAVSPAAAPARECLDRLGIEPGAFWLFAGRLSPEKELHTLIEAARPLLGRVSLVIAGSASYSPAYAERLRRSAGPHVRFLGAVDRATMSELYAACAAYVLPSSVEGLSVSLLEALSHGCCIVTSDLAENREVVADSALLFPTGDGEALRQRLAYLVAHPNAAAELRRRAASRAATLPDWDEVARQTESLFLRLVRSAHPRHHHD